MDQPQVYMCPPILKIILAGQLSLAGMLGRRRRQEPTFGLDRRDPHTETVTREGPPAPGGPGVPEPGASLGPHALRGGSQAPTAPPGPVICTQGTIPPGQPHRAAEWPHPEWPWPSPAPPPAPVSSLTPSRCLPGGSRRQAGQGLRETMPLRLRAHGQTPRTTGR